MDLVNSVTQNSNNRNVPMENRGDGGDDGDDGRKNRPNHDTSSSSDTQKNHGSANNTRTVQQVKPIPLDGNEAKNQIPEYLRVIGMDPRKFWPKKYRFTREKSPGQYNPLTIAQRNFYETNGYLVIDQCASPRLLDAIRTQYKESTLVDEFLLNKLVAKNKRLSMYVKCFCDERLMLMTNQLLDSFQKNETAKDIIDNKQSQRQQLFRDWIYLPFRPIDKVVCAVTAIDELDHVIIVVPGTHRVGQCSISSTLETITAAYETSQESSQRAMARELYECAPENLSSLVEKSKKGFRYVNLKPGQTLFYHPGLIHGFSGDLVNFRKRQLASLAYYAAADCEYVDYRKSSDLKDTPVPISLAHFKDKHPSDYSSWVGKPKLLIQEEKANM